MVISTLLLGACAKSAPPPSAPVPTTATSSTTAAQQSNATLEAYERIRALLADDKFDGVADTARTLEQAAKSEQGPHYAAIATSATKLAASADIDGARDAFGEVSKHVVALLASDPTLARDQHVFECPMVKGYNKWVQPTDDLQNPYMGKRMLACGRKSDSK